MREKAARVTNQEFESLKKFMRKALSWRNVGYLRSWIVKNKNINNGVYHIVEDPFRVSKKMKTRT